METIKISVEVSVNLSESTQNFIKSMFAAGIPSGAPAQVAAQPAKPAAPAQPAQPAKPAAPAQPAQPAPTKPVAPAQPAQPAPTKPAAPAAPSAPAPTKPVAPAAPSAPAAPAASSANKSIEDVREMLAQKVNAHRDAIKSKLNKLSASSVTKLDPSKYDEMYDFLANLV